MKSYRLLSAVVLCLALQVRAEDQIRVACIGDSITAGVGAGKHACWVTLVQNALGDKWQLENLGVSASTMLRNGDKPYHKLGAFAKALDMKPDLALIALGTNDSKPQNWKHKDEFAADYKAMIAELRKANPKVRVYCVLPVPAYPGNFGINDTTIKDEVIPLIKEVAKETKTELIDMYTPMIGKGEFVKDKVHPNAQGHLIMAAPVYKALTGKDAPEGALKASPPPPPKEKKKKSATN